jgi:hypothetical protein
MSERSKYMQRLIYTIDIDEEFVGMDGILGLLDAEVESRLDCIVIRSKLESPDEIAYEGDWEDEI